MKKRLSIFQALLLIGGLIFSTLGVLTWFEMAWQYDFRPGDAWEAADKSYKDGDGIIHIHYEDDAFSYGLRVNRRTGQMQKTIACWYEHSYENEWEDVNSVEEYKILMTESQKYWNKKTIESEIKTEKENLKKREWQKALKELISG